MLVLIAAFFTCRPRPSIRRRRTRRIRQPPPPPSAPAPAPAPAAPLSRVEVAQAEPHRTGPAVSCRAGVHTTPPPLPSPRPRIHHTPCTTHAAPASPHPDVPVLGPCGAARPTAQQPAQQPAQRSAPQHGCGPDMTLALALAPTPVSFMRSSIPRSINQSIDPSIHPPLHLSTGVSLSRLSKCPTAGPRQPRQQAQLVGGRGWVGDARPPGGRGPLPLISLSPARCSHPLTYGACLEMHLHPATSVVLWLASRQTAGGRADE